MVDAFQFKKIGRLSPTAQVILICLSFVGLTLLSYESYVRSGEVFGMPFAVTMLFAPIFEELIFRGWILGALRRRYSVTRAIVFSSLLFGLWHFKNIFYFDWGDLAYQMVYAAVVVGPLLGWVAMKVKSVWPGVILHYLNNVGSLALMMVSLDWRDLF
ncbi:MAG: CPBP family intramembrane glutamic endopeptidase [Candidatus Gracilibacteria bacterium]|jgi:hypothetical protein